MVATTAPGARPGSPLPDVTLPDADGVAHRLHDLLGAGPTLLAVVCNHCPYVQHIEHALGAMAAEFRPRGLATIAVTTNDVAEYPDDGPEGMRAQSARAGWGFPYLYDAEHALALEIGAVCTPDLFVYDASRRLAHRGAFDASTPRNGQPLTGDDLRRAIEAVLAGDAVPEGLTPSLGCSIKWMDGRAPE